MFRKSQQLSYGITGILLTIRGLVHDLLVSCVRPRLLLQHNMHMHTHTNTNTNSNTNANTTDQEVEIETMPTISNDRTVATICVSLVTNALKIVSEYYWYVELLI